jgi:hypothetical protein
MNMEIVGCILCGMGIVLLIVWYITAQLVRVLRILQERIEKLEKGNRNER